MIKLWEEFAALNDNLSHDLSRKLGSYEQSNVYHVEVLDGEIWFGYNRLSGNKRGKGNVV